MFVFRPVTFASRSDDNYCTTLTITTKRLMSLTRAGPNTPRSETADESLQSRSRGKGQDPHILRLVSDHADQDPSSDQGLRTVFRGLGDQFIPLNDIPGHDVIVVGDSDEEEK
jgi:hypothetical protein